MFEKVLIATDGTPFAEEALSTAIDLARASTGHLRLVSVIEEPSHGTSPDARAFYDSEVFSRLSEEVAKLAQAAVDKDVARARDQGLEASGTVRRGRPVEQIMREAKEWGADAIVMSTHGRTGLSRLLLGSVAQSVVHEAECPVVLVRPSSGDRAS